LFRFKTYSKHKTGREREERKREREERKRERKREGAKLPFIHSFLSLDSLQSGLQSTSTSCQEKAFDVLV